MEPTSPQVPPSVTVAAPPATLGGLRNSHAEPAKDRLSPALHGASDGFWDWDLQTDEVYYSRQWKEMLGYADGELENHLDTWKRLVDPADRDHALEVARGVAEGRLPKFSVEFRMRHKDGHWVDIMSRALIVRDEFGRPRRLVGTHVDITELRQKEMEIRRLNDSLEQRVRERTAELQASQARLALLVETVPAAILIHGPDGRIVHINLTAQRLLGLCDAEVIGKPLEDGAWCFLHEDGRPMKMSDFPVAQVLQHRTAFWNRVVGIDRGDGQVVWALVNALPQIGPDGQITEVIVGFMDVTARVVAEAALRQANETLEQQVAQRTAALQESESRFRTLAEATFEGVMLSRHGIIQDCNEQLGNILGCHSAELIGRGVLDFVPPEWQDVVREAIRTGRQSAFEHEALRKDGSRRIVETHGRSPEGADGIRLTAIRDITERKQAEEALRESETRFRQLAEVSTDAIAISEDQRLVDGNTQLASLLGWDLKEMIGRSILDFVPEHSRESVAGRLRIATKSVYESYALRKDGVEIPVEICGQTMQWQGKPRRVSIMRDLTDNRRAAEQLESLRAALERSRRMAELSEVSAAVVHQLGQPFSAIAGNVSAARNLLVQDGCQLAAMDEALAAVEADLQTVRSIMSQLRALIHPEHAKREPANLNDLVDEVLRVLQTEAQRGRICIDFSPAEGLPAVAVDRVQISQVIFNLIRNAFDAVAPCPVKRRVVAITTAATQAGGVELMVRDQGTGIALGMEKQIFDAFFSTKSDGMGIGLRISRTITRAHGGHLEGGNNPDGPGAWFRLVLPAGGAPRSPKAAE